MKLIGLMLVRNEDWCIGASLRVALRWCDSVLVMDHASTDATENIVRQVSYAGENVLYHKWEDGSKFDEMFIRQEMLELARDEAGTHFAVVDGDEVATLNICGNIRSWFEILKPGELIELPRLAMSDLNRYWDDGSEHAEGGITLGFCDHPELAWAPRGKEQYHFHQRAPAGSGPISLPIGRDRSKGGVMHLQYANKSRLTQKHLWYSCVERLRWPGRKTPEELNSIYGAALATPTRTADIPSSWWGGEKDFIDLSYRDHWHLFDIRRMIKENGRGFLEGLNLRGLEV